MLKPDVAAFFDPRTHSIQYVVSDPQTKACAIIDPVLDFDEKSGLTATHNADALLDGGQLPEPEDNEIRYLKLPIGAFQAAVWS